VLLESANGTAGQIVAIEAGITVADGAALAGRPRAPVSGWIAVTAPSSTQVFENKRLLAPARAIA
jgi:hypothetical protein